MGKVTVFNIIVPVITVMMFLSFSNAASAQAVYGCAKDEIVMLKSGKCPICSSGLSIVQEGYIYDGNKVILDTLSREEKDKMEVKGDNKFLVVIYKSPSAEASFSPRLDKSRKPLKRQIVELKYDCNGVLSSRSLSAKCQLLGDAPGTREKEKAEDLKKQEREKMETEKRILKESMKKSMNLEIEESWPLFYEQQKELKISEEEIKEMWEKQKMKMYEKYNYDPETDTFAKVETLDELKEKGERIEKEVGLRESMKKELEESWPIFYKRQKDAGLSDAEIQALWEDEKSKVYEKYGYDAETDTFVNIETP